MKRTLLFVLLLHAAVAGFSQNNNADSLSLSPIRENVLKGDSRFSINIHGGYAFGLGSTFKFYPDNVSSIRMTQMGNNTPSKTTVYNSPTRGLGEGFRVGIGGSYILNDFINLGLDLDYFKSTIYKDRDSSFNRTQITGAPNGMNTYSYTENTRISYEATLLTLSPNITFKAVSRSKWYLYNKLGAVITFRPNSIQNNTQDISTRTGWQGFFKDSAVNNKQTFEWGIRNPAFGFMGGVGAQFKLSQKIRAYGEIQFSHIVFTVRKRTTTAFLQNGADVIGNLTNSERVILFKDSYVENRTPDVNAPSFSLTERIPITYVGFQAGLSYRF